MLYIFKSSSTADVIMQRFIAENILSVIGKPPGKTGVITVSEMDDALSKIEYELERQAQVEQGLAHTGTEITIQNDNGQFRRNAIFVLDLLRTSKAAGNHVTWGL